ncbi:MAG: NAD(P)-dependent glycerol-3-phosphate dehydrogenase [Alphaproteobacteria bacterium]|nr:NAD(P)-dependent glycerol-3-phosphate dehydrogenase [Alphaproteobacteria bacterium]
MTRTISIIGAGAWGTALAQAYAIAGRPVRLWAREAELARVLNVRHENPTYLPGAPLDPRIEATADLAQAMGADILLLVTPAQSLRSMLTSMKPMLRPDVPVVLCAKGIEIGTGRLLSAIVQEMIPQAPLAVLSGPTFAGEVVQGLPAAMTLAIADNSIASALQADLSTPRLRAYLSDDLIGVQVGGAIKNVIAIACGIAQGKGYGESARAALIARGLAEITRLAVALGGKAQTMLGLSGVGDLTLTCNSMRSRNFSLGVALGQGQSLQSILDNRAAVTEGIYTAQAASALAQQIGVDMPITKAVQACLQEGLAVDKAIEALLNRSLKDESA